MPPKAFRLRWRRPKAEPLRPCTFLVTSHAENNWKSEVWLYNGWLSSDQFLGPPPSVFSRPDVGADVPELASRMPLTLTELPNIFHNDKFSDEAIGLKDLEAEAVTKFPLDFISKGHDFQARVHWEKASVVLSDGRTTLRKWPIYCLDQWLMIYLDTGTVDYDTSTQARHLFRLAAMTETLISVEKWEISQSNMAQISWVVCYHIAGTWHFALERIRFECIRASIVYFGIVTYGLANKLLI